MKSPVYWSWVDRPMKEVVISISKPQVAYLSVEQWSGIFQDREVATDIIICISNNVATVDNGI